MSRQEEHGTPVLRWPQARLPWGSVWQWSAFPPCPVSRPCCHTHVFFAYFTRHRLGLAVANSPFGHLGRHLVRPRAQTRLLVLPAMSGSSSSHVSRRIWIFHQMPGACSRLGTSRHGGPFLLFTAEPGHDVRVAAELGRCFNRGPWWGPTPQASHCKRGRTGTQEARRAPSAEPSPEAEAPPHGAGGRRAFSHMPGQHPAAGADHSCGNGGCTGGNPSSVTGRTSEVPSTPVCSQ